MNREFLILVVALILMDIIDGDFASFSVLDVVKVILYIICLCLAIRKGKK